MIPVNEPKLGKRELEYVTECVQTGWVSSVGHFIEKFETGWASYCGRKYGVAVSNGTTALQVAITTLDLKPGDEVIMPSFTIISCALAVVNVGAIPVLVDCKSDTWTMDVDEVAKKITSRTRAIMAVHIYGHPVDMDPILKLAESKGLAVIEDAAEAHGAEYLTRWCPESHLAKEPQWKRCGCFGTISTFSFYANKLVTTGEGGMVLTDDENLAERMRQLRNLCFGQEHRFLHESLGFNFRLTNLQAALGVAQIERIEETIAHKRKIGTAYTNELSSFDCLQLPVEKEWAKNVYWMYGLVLSDSIGMNAAQFAQCLEKKGVQTRPFFFGMHEQPVLKRLGLFKNENYPVTERIARRGLYLPSGTALTEKQLQTVCIAIKEVLS